MHRLFVWILSENGKLFVWILSRNGKLFVWILSANIVKSLKSNVIQRCEMYKERNIDKALREWALKSDRKPLLLRGARQVGKSTAIRHLGESFASFVEINFEKQPSAASIFSGDLNAREIASKISNLTGKVVQPGQTLLFLDEIHACPNAIMALRFFKEDFPELHVAAAGSLLEFALAELPTFGVGRMHSLFMYPMSFDEFLAATGQQGLILERQKASVDKPLDTVFHLRLVEQFRNFIMVGGMPEVVCCWDATRDYLQCQELQDQLILSYEDDFSKYRKRVDPVLLRQVLRSAALQITSKFVYRQASEQKAVKVREAVELLTMAGLLTPVTKTSGNGLPLGAGADGQFRKLLLLDSGLTLRLLNMSLGSVQQITEEILTATETDLVNKGKFSEMIAGLEIIKHMSPAMRHDMFYWLREERNSLAEVDYLEPYNGAVLPIEIKAETQGGMKSLWQLMREKGLSYAIRCSLENFGKFDYVDEQSLNFVRHIDVYPLYAMAQMPVCR